VDSPPVRTLIADVAVVERKTKEIPVVTRTGLHVGDVVVVGAGTPHEERHVIVGFTTNFTVPASRLRRRRHHRPGIYRWKAANNSHVVDPSGFQRRQKRLEVAGLEDGEQGSTTFDSIVLRDALLYDQEGATDISTLLPWNKVELTRLDSQTGGVTLGPDGVTEKQCKDQCDSSTDCRSIFVGDYGTPRWGECYPLAVSEIEDGLLLPAMLSYHARAGSYSCAIVDHFVEDVTCSCTNAAVFSALRGSQDGIAPDATFVRAKCKPADDTSATVVVEKNVSKNEVLSLEMKKVPLVRLSATLLAGFENLEKLAFPSCQISTVGIGSFEGMPFLEELDLRDNPILAIGEPDVGIVAGAFAPDNNVRMLTVTESNVTAVTWSSFNKLGLKNLTHLTLESTRLTTVGINAFEPLESLVVSGLKMLANTNAAGMATSNCFYLNEGRGIMCDCAEGFFPDSDKQNHP
jgi:hypothetical protein